MYWKGLTTRGAVIGGWSGLIVAVTLMILGPTIWVSILGHDTPIYPYEYPALFSMIIAFIVSWLFSITDNSSLATQERMKFEAQFIRSQIGIGAEQGKPH